MTTEGGRPIDGALSPVPEEFCPGGLERLRKESGLTWRGLAASAAIAWSDAKPLRRVARFQSEPGQRGIVALVRALNGGDDLGTSGNDAAAQNGNPDRDGHGG